jgi:imidazole glycerol phosphate synthase glutamine amidotransferase subunit
VRRAATAADLADAGHVVLPGVGAFDAGLAALRGRDLDAALRERVVAERPTLAICLGLQLLCFGSDEAPGVPGLGVLPTRVRRLPETVRTPNMGWCAVVEAAGGHVGWAYFAHSYAVPGDGARTLRAAGWRTLLIDHGGPRLAAARRGGVLACQFHPELSGGFGATLLANWLRDPGREEAPWRP